MRSKKIIIIPICLALAFFSLFWLFEPAAKPSISMGVLRYVDRSNLWFPAAIVGITNNGATTVRYDHVNSDEVNLLRMESRTGQVEKVFDPVGGITIPPELLKPGSNIILLVPLSRGTFRWQLRYTIRRASSRDRAESKLTGNVGDRLYKLFGHLLSTNEGPPVEIWSELFEVPKSIDSP